MVGCLETVIRHLVILDANVGSTVGLRASDAEFARERAWISRGIQKRAISVWAHHLARAAHFQARVAREIDSSG